MPFNLVIHYKVLYTLNVFKCFHLLICSQSLYIQDEFSHWNKMSWFWTLYFEALLYWLLRTSLFICLVFNGYLFLGYIVWLIWFISLFATLIRGHPGLSNDLSCVWGAPLARNNHKQVKLKDTCFLGSQEDIVVSFKEP